MMMKLTPWPDGLNIRTKGAMRVLENHIRDRMPFVQVSSERVQVLMGVKNKLSRKGAEILS